MKRYISKKERGEEEFTKKRKNAIAVTHKHTRTLIQTDRQTGRQAGTHIHPTNLFALFSVYRLHDVRAAALATGPNAWHGMAFASASALASSKSVANSAAPYSFPPWLQPYP